MKLRSHMQSFIARFKVKRSQELSIEDRNVRYFSIDTAFQGFIQGGIATYISVFVVRLGASSLLVSLLSSLPAIVGVLLSIPAGWFVERQRDPVRLTNLWRIVHRGMFLVIGLLPFFIHGRLAEAVVIVWTINSIPAALINLSWTTVVAEIVPPRRRASVNGRRWALLSLVTAISVAGYGYLLEHVIFPLGYQIVFAASFLGGLVSIYFFSLLKIPAAPGNDENPLPKVQAVPASSPVQRMRRYLSSFAEAPEFLRYLGATSVLRIGLNLPAALYSIYWVRTLGASDLWIGYRATAASLALIVGYFFWGRVASRRGHHLVLLVCTLGLGLHPVLTGLVKTQAWLPAVAVVQGFFATGIDLAFFDTLLQVCPAKQRSSFIAVNVVFANLGMFVGPILGSLMTRWLDIRTVFFIAGSIHVLAVILFRALRIGADEHEAA